MITHSSQTRTLMRTLPPYVLITLVFLAVSIFECRLLIHESYLCFGDAHVYARGIAAFNTGGDAYASRAGALNFVYPPWFLYMARWAGSLLAKHGGWFLYLGASSIGLLSVPLLLSRFYIASEWLTSLVAMVLFTFQPRLEAELTLLTGNIANILYALILLTGISGVRRNYWLYFYFSVAFAALIKPPFLAFLLLPVLAGKKQLWRSALCVVFAGGFYMLQRMAMPSLYMNFRNAVYQQLVLNRDAGYGVYFYVSKLGHILGITQRPSVVMALHFTIIGALFLGLFAFRKYRSRASVERLWLPVLIVAAILSNPRLQGYDWVVAILPAIYICIECLRTPGSHRKTALVAIFVTIFSKLFASPELAICLLLITAVGLVIFRLADEHRSGQLSESLLLDEHPPATFLARP